MRLKFRFRRILLLVTVVTVLSFLTVQFYFVQYVGSETFSVGRQVIPGHNGSNLPDPSTKRISTVPNDPHVKPDQTYGNVKSFVSIFERFRYRVFLIDPYVLQSVMNNATSVQMCRFLCIKKTVISFAVLGNNTNLSDKILQVFQDESFDIVPISDRSLKHFNPDAKTKDIATHYFFLRKKQYIHLMILFERDGGYLWHSKITLQGGKIAGDFPLNPAALDFGNSMGIYKKFDVLKVEMDGVKLYAPQYPLLFLEQMAHSLFIECNHTQAQHFYTSYRPHNDLEYFLFRKRARNLLAQAKDTLDQLGIPFWISSGTLLGWFRQCDIIPYSKDVDIGVFIKDYDIRLIPAMTMMGVPLKHLFGQRNDSYELSFQAGEIKLDIFFFYEETDHMWNGGTQAKTGKKFKYSFPKFTLCWTEFLELIVRVPCNTLPYIKANYGENWHVPVRSWDWKASPPNVRPNGQWDEALWPVVIQTFD